MREILRRIHYLLNRRRFDRELASDLEFHREMAARGGGMQLGNALRLREEARDAWGWTWVERLSQDLRYATRLLRRSPGFTLAAILILAVGIGVNVAAFGYFNLLVLRPLPVHDPATLVRFQRSAPKGYASVLPYPEVAFFREHSTTLAAVLAWSPASLTLEREEKPTKAHFVTANLLAELGALPHLGRILDASRDETGGAEPVAVMSYGLWERHFGADASIIGRTIHLNGKPVTVVGVASEGFSGLSLDSPDLWLPVNQQPYFISGGKLLTDYSVAGTGLAMWGRLRPGYTPGAAQQELRALAAVLHREHPNDIWENETFPASPGAYATSAISQGHHGTGSPGPNRLIPVAAMIGTLVLLILMVACGNLGSLLLARGIAREREIAIRTAVGAGRLRLVRQLFTESVLLALLGSVAGLGLGYVVLRGVMTISGTPTWLNPTPDWRVILFAAATGFGSAIVFGLTPAFHVVRQRHRTVRVRQVLIGAQVAASCVLLIVAGLLVRTLNLAAGDPGFEFRQVVSIDPALGSHGYTAVQAQSYIDTLQRRLREVPGVQSVAFATSPPYGNKTVTIGTEVGGRAIRIQTNSVDAQYFHTLKIPLLRGQDFSRGEPHTMIVSQSMALSMWPGEEAIGKTFDLESTKYTVAGIAGNARVGQDPGLTQAYFLAGPQEMGWGALLVRTAGPPEGIAPALASMARAIDPKVLPEVQLMKSSFARKLEGTTYSTLAVSVLAMVALLLACLGIVGLVAYAVSQRTKEIGIRMALGATRSQILSIALGQLSRPVLAGLVVGTGGALALSQILERILFGLGRPDPVAYLGAIGLFAAAAALASVLPARRALRIDPMRALRTD